MPPLGVSLTATQTAPGVASSQRTLVLLEALVRVR